MGLFKKKSSPVPTATETQEPSVKNGKEVKKPGFRLFNKKPKDELKKKENTHQVLSLKFL